MRRRTPRFTETRRKVLPPPTIRSSQGEPQREIRRSISNTRSTEPFELSAPLIAGSAPWQRPRDACEVALPSLARRRSRPLTDTVHEWCAHARKFSQLATAIPSSCFARCVWLVPSSLSKARRHIAAIPRPEIINATHQRSGTDERTSWRECITRDISPSESGTMPDSGRWRLRRPIDSIAPCRKADVHGYRAGRVWFKVDGTRRLAPR
jgi:hypothetical protein